MDETVTTDQKNMTHFKAFSRHKHVKLNYFEWTERKRILHGLLNLIKLLKEYFIKIKSLKDFVDSSYEFDKLRDSVEDFCMK